MPGLNHSFGHDLVVSPTGDLALVSGTVEGQQRVLRRLLTNPGAYIWELSYGAGLARFLGKPASATRIAAVARSQMFMEPAVARTPAPDIAVSVAASGVVVLNIRYADAATGASVPLTLPVAG